MLHPARAIPFRDLYDGLREQAELGRVSRRTDPLGNLDIWCYTKECVFDGEWNKFTILARGLITDSKNGLVVATPFPKFFNYGEQPEINEVPSVPFHSEEKLDGSLIVVFQHAGEWNTATKGSFSSEQALLARSLIPPKFYDHAVDGATYLFELVGPSNRIVINYPNDELVFLSAYLESGAEFTRGEIDDFAAKIEVRTAKIYGFADFSRILDEAEKLGGDQEGWVIRFENGHRMKVKGAEYRRLHSFISGVTPLAIWRLMRDGLNVDAYIRDVPEEFRGDAEKIRDILNFRVQGIILSAHSVVQSVSGLTDKDIGLRLSEFPDHIRSLIFPLRKMGMKALDVPKTRRHLFERVKPKANRLEGYTPSSSITRVFDESI